MKKTFVKVRSIKDIVVFVSLIIVGIILVVLPVDAGVSIAGFFCILVGVLLAFLMKSEYMEQETGEKYHKKEYYFQPGLHTTLSTAIATNPNSVNLAEEGKGKTVRLDIYFSKKANKSYMQLFRYVPHIYEPSTKVYEYNIAEVANLIK